MLKLAALASGSAGNCAVVSDGRTHILLDAGISARRTVTGLKSLGLDPAGLSAVLITHEHSDHISGLSTLKKQFPFPLYTAGPTARQLCCRIADLEGRIHICKPGEAFEVGSLQVMPFPILHDGACPVGYTVASSSGEKLALATDLGTVTPEVEAAVAGARLLFIEANYDLDTLRAGRYPTFLKERILGDYGHLSNKAGGALALFAAGRGARRVVLGHLSQNNNTPQIAFETVAYILAGGGVRVGRDLALSVASRSECGGWMEV